MTPEERRVALAWMQKSQEALEESQLLVKHGYFRGAANRVYFACFHSVWVLLYVDKKTQKSHSGLRGIFNKDYVRTGEVSLGSGHLFNALYDVRLSADYGDAYPAEQVRAWVEEAPRFIEEIAACIRARGVTEDS